MKVSLNNNTIQVSRRLSSQAFLNKVKKGATITVKIVNRISEKEAVLDFNGQRIKAAFKRGVPNTDTLLLKLDDNSSSFVFSIVTGNSKEEVFSKIYEYLFLPPDEIDNPAIFELKRFLGNRTLSLLDLNLILAGLYKKNRPGTTGAAWLFNKLHDNGVPRESILYLSFLFSHSKTSSLELYPLLLLLGYQRNTIHKWLNDPAGENVSIIDELGQIIDNIHDNEQKKELLQGFFALLSAKDKEYINSIFYFDKKFKEARYFGDKKSIIVSIELSNLGKIDIGCRIPDNGQMEIVLMPYQENTVKYLETKIKILYTELEDSGINPLIRIYNYQQFNDKIVDIFSRYSINRALDVKV